ncbi:hypothetical protein BAY59_24285 [Prauserella coralliicola]|nr:hypothetical protein BAY59_24285 [Prauserella coralliicola]
MADRNLVEYELTVGDKSWRLKMADILIDEWCELEDLTGMDAGELYARFLAGGMRAKKAFVYLARKKSGAEVPWDSPELNFRTGDYSVKDVTPKVRRKPSKPAAEPEAEQEAEQDPTEEAATPPSATS